MMAKISAAALVLAMNFYVYHFMATEEVVPERRDFSGFPLQLGEWECPEQGTIEPDVLENLGATDYIVCDFRKGDSSVGVNLYVGYHATQVREEGGGAGENAIHPPEHCLPGGGWDIIDARIVPLDLPGLPQEAGLLEDGPHAKRFVIAKGDRRQLAYFWYQSRGRVLTRGTDLILHRFWDRAWKQRTDGALVRFTVPIVQGNVEQAEERFRSLASRVVPRLASYVPE